jgi:hypothetical protein
MSGLVAAAAELEVVRPEHPLWSHVTFVRLSQQPGNHPVGHHRCRLPAARLQRWIEVSELRPESRLS